MSVVRSWSWVSRAGRTAHAGSSSARSEYSCSSLRRSSGAGCSRAGATARTAGVLDAGKARSLPRKRTKSPSERSASNAYAERGLTDARSICSPGARVSIESPRGLPIAGSNPLLIADTSPQSGIAGDRKDPARQRPILLQQLDERSAVQPQPSRRLGLVAPDGQQRLLDELALQRLDVGVEIQRSLRPRLRAGLRIHRTGGGRGRVNRQPFGIADRPPFDDVLQLPDVSRPGVSLDRDIVIDHVDRRGLRLPRHASLLEPATSKAWLPGRSIHVART